MTSPSFPRARAFARRHRPALVLSTGALVIALAGTLTGAALTGGHDEHGWTGHGRQVELREGAPAHP